LAVIILPCVSLTDSLSTGEVSSLTSV